MQTADLVDVLAQIPDDLAPRAAVELGGIGVNVSVALVRDGVAFGRIVAARQEVRPSLTSRSGWSAGFADQAVIAIENVRHFKDFEEARWQSEQIATVPDCHLRYPQGHRQFPRYVAASLEVIVDTSQETSGEPTRLQ